MVISYRSTMRVYLLRSAAILIAAITAACGASTDAFIADCEQSDYPSTVAVAEASGAARIMMHGAPVLVVIADSGNRGAYAAIDVATGALRQNGQLPLGATSDDLEGATTLDGDLLAVTSAGWTYRWHFDDNSNAFVLVAVPTPLATVDPNIPLDGGLGDKVPPAGAGMVCGAQGVNCGRNFEGICLAPQPSATPGACIGLAVAKADGRLYCITRNGNSLHVEQDRSFALGNPGALADCMIDEQNRAWIGANSYSVGRVFVLTDWANVPTAPSITTLDAVTVGFPEAIYAADGAVLRFDDNGRPGPSLMAKFTCNF
jgi:hypothetical protein